MSTTCHTYGSHTLPATPLPHPCTYLDHPLTYSPSRPLNMNSPHTTPHKHPHTPPHTPHTAHHRKHSHSPTRYPHSFTLPYIHLHATHTPSHSPTFTYTLPTLHTSQALTTHTPHTTGTQTAHITGTNRIQRSWSRSKRGQWKVTVAPGLAVMSIPCRSRLAFTEEKIPLMIERLIIPHQST